MFVIYLITFNKDIYNFNDDHFYVGQHKTNNINDNYMGTGAIVKKVYKQFGKNGATKSILAIAETLEVANILEKHFISEFKKTYGKNCFNIQKGGRNNLDFQMPEDAHKRNVESLRTFWKNNKYSENVKIRNQRISDKMKGYKNGMGHTCKHNDETKKKISESVRRNESRIPKIREKSSKKIYVYVYDKNELFERSNVKYSWKDLGFTSEAACQRYTRYCSAFVKGLKDVTSFSKHFNVHFGKIFVSYEPFNVSFIKTLK